MNTLRTELLATAIGEQLDNVKIGPSGSGVGVRVIGSDSDQLLIELAWSGPLGEDFREVRTLTVSDSDAALRPAYVDATAYGDPEPVFIPAEERHVWKLLSEKAGVVDGILTDRDAVSELPAGELCTGLGTPPVFLPAAEAQQLGVTGLIAGTLTTLVSGADRRPIDDATTEMTWEQVFNGYLTVQVDDSRYTANATVGGWKVYDGDRSVGGWHGYLKFEAASVNREAILDWLIQRATVVLVLYPALDFTVDVLWSAQATDGCLVMCIRAADEAGWPGHAPSVAQAG